MTEQNTNLEKRELILELISLTQELERPPTEEELDQYGEFQYQQYENEFGDLYIALRESGILPDSVTREKFYNSELSVDSSTKQEESNPERTEEVTKLVEETIEQEVSSERERSGLIDSVSSSDFAELTDFRRDILIILSASDILKGLEVKEELENYYADEIHHGRLYPNLDELVENGFVEKTEIDKRTNGYSLTEIGQAHVKARRRWEEKQLSGVPTDADLSHADESADSTESQSSTQPSPEISQESGSEQSAATSDESYNTEQPPSETSEGLLDEIMSEFDGLAEDSLSEE